MDGKGKISEYRDRLDKALTSADLTDEETLQDLIKNQLRQSSLNNDEECSQNLLERKTVEVWNFLEMLRSTSSVSADRVKTHESSHSDWKLKDDNEEFRVMYREGPQGTPYHTLLVEGYVDGPMDVCMCVSWESSLYKKWWPQFTFPPFKLVSCKCLQKVRMGEQISIARLKVPWPLSMREAVVHYFEFEYFKEDLVVILLNSVSDSESIDDRTHGYSRDIIPEAKDAVRIGLEGGYVMQKVTSSRSYFRILANVDLKLDLVPSFLINFISRQLIGSGFRLYQKTVASVLQADEDFSKALMDPLYSRIRESLFSSKELDKSLESKVDHHSGESEIEDLREQAINNAVPEVQNGQNSKEGLLDDTQWQDREAICEIEEVKDDDEGELDECIVNNSNINMKSRDEINKRIIYIRPEVKEALGTLDKVISVVRQYRANTDSISSSDITISDPVDLQSDGELEPTFVSGVGPSNEDPVKLPTKEPSEGLLVEPRHSSSGHGYRLVKSSILSGDAHHNKIVPTSTPPVEMTVIPNQIDRIASCFSDGPTLETSKQELATDEQKETSIKAWGGPRKQRKYGLCCFHCSAQKLDHEDI